MRSPSALLELFRKVQNKYIPLLVEESCVLDNVRVMTFWGNISLISC